MSFKAEWTGSGFCFCHGKWKLFKDGEDISYVIPGSKKEKPMDTFGEYSRWYFKNWCEEWETYEDGLKIFDWIDENYDWLSNFCNSPKEMREVYDAFQAEDWRYGSCGGCI